MTAAVGNREECEVATGETDLRTPLRDGASDDELAALLAGDWDVADASEQRHRREGAGIVAAYLQWHLERGVRSLRLVDRSTVVRPTVQTGGLPA